MELSVRIYSDYVCPFCFLHEGPLYDAVKCVEQEREETIEVKWMPFELRPEPTPTLRPEGEYLQTAWARSRGSKRKRGTPLVHAYQVFKILSSVGADPLRGVSLHPPGRSLKDFFHL